MCGAICGDNHTERPWWPTEERWNISPAEKVRTDCCYRRVPASETICRLRTQEIPVGGRGDYHECEPWLSTIYENGEPVGQEYRAVDWFTYASYYDSTWRVECNPDGGCKANPRKRRGMHLREPRG